MHTVDIDKATVALVQLVEQAAVDGEIVLRRAGQPAARLLPIEPTLRKPRVLGSLKGRISVPDDFDAPLPDDLLDLFEGR